MLDKVWQRLCDDGHDNTFITQTIALATEDAEVFDLAIRYMREPSHAARCDLASLIADEIQGQLEVYGCIPSKQWLLGWTSNNSATNE